MPAKMTADEFIKKGKEKYGEDTFGYDKVIYQNNKTKVIITCNTCGHDFPITPHDFLGGHACPDCGGSKPIDESKYFIMLQEKGWNYISIVKYNGYGKKSDFYCEKHKQSFEAIPKYMIVQASPSCEKCKKDHKLIQNDNSRKWTEESFIEFCSKMPEHKDLEYIHDGTFKGFSNNEKAKIHYRCKICGYDTPQDALNHKNGASCPTCSGHAHMTNEYFIKQARKKHGDFYDYSDVDVDNRDEKGCVNIICPIHGAFPQTPNSHLMGQGCPTCGHGFSKSKVLSLLNKSDLENLSIAQLYFCMDSGIFPASFKKLTFSAPGSKERRDTIKKLKEDLNASETEEDFEETEKEKIQEQEKEYEDEAKKSLEIDEKSFGSESISSLFDSNTESSDVLIKGLKANDNLKLKISFDENGEFIAKESLCKMLLSWINEGDGFIEKIKDESFGDYSSVIVNRFLEIVSAIEKLNPGDDCTFKYAKNPYLTQKLCVYFISKRNEFGDWIQMGGGKTFTCYWAVREVGAKVAVHFVPNHLKLQAVNDLITSYPDTNIIVPKRPEDIHALDRNKYNAIIVSYEIFQREGIAGQWIKALLKNKIDFVSLDEVQKIKRRYKEKISRRSKSMETFLQHARKNNPEMKTFVMSGTPIINNLTEAKSVIDMLTGTNHTEIGNRIKTQNIMNAHKAFVLNGFRYIPKYNLAMEEQYPKIDGSDIVDDLVQCKNHNDELKIETILIKKKLKWCIDNNILKKGTVIYTHYVQGITGYIRSQLEDIVDETGKQKFKVGLYTGYETRKDISDDSKTERDVMLESFINGDIDILIASSPIMEGTNGLQTVCDTMIVLSLPWTASELEQLCARIYRPGSNFKKVTFIIPQVCCSLPSGLNWSYDMRRMAWIMQKKTLVEVVLDSVYTHLKNYNSEYARKVFMDNAIKALHNGFVAKDVVREEIKAEDIDTTVPKRKKPNDKAWSILQKEKNSPVDSIMEKCYDNDESKAEKYNEDRLENEKKAPENPIDHVAKIIRRNYASDMYKVIADLGCGNNPLEKRFVNEKRKFINVDLFESKEKNIIKANCANLKGIIDDESVNIVVHCKSYWGFVSEWNRYFNEDYRILKKGIGTLLVVQPKSRFFGKKRAFQNVEAFVKAVESAGFKLKDQEPRDRYMYFQFTK